MMHPRPEECKSINFLVDVRDNNYNNVDSLNYYIGTIEIVHKGIDIIVRHVPRISVISLACDFGGLLGLWLGWSMMSLMNISSELLVKFYNTKS